MSLTFQPLQALDQVYAADTLFGAWLRGLGAVGRGATRELEDLLLRTPAPAAAAPAPFFEAMLGRDEAGAWRQAMLADLPHEPDRVLFEENLQALAAGRAEVVITGQQPGVLGAPVYTLHKIATAVALARQLTAAGRPTVPVFWSGDDDDDLAEALGPHGWDPRRAEVFQMRGKLRSLIPASGRRPCVGNLPAATWSLPTSQWLLGEGVEACLSPLGRELQGLWMRACRENWSLSRLNRRYLLHLFAGQGLLVVSGNDPRLHAAAAELYSRILPLRSSLAAAARRRGAELAGSGFSVPVNERSLQRHLFVSHGDGRRFLDPEGDLPPSSDLRPGVLLRSCVQDWLFRPVAVIVGPGELAYLRQLDPVYQSLGIARSALVPRLFAWVAPENYSRDQLAAASGGEDLSGRADLLAASAARVAEEAVRDILIREVGVDGQRAGHLAAGRARRWQRSWRPCSAVKSETSR
jgi:hypothetical protein